MCDELSDKEVCIEPSLVTELSGFPSPNSTCISALKDYEESKDLMSRQPWFCVW
jgi:hypothetical protein